MKNGIVVLMCCALLGGLVLTNCAQDEPAGLEALVSPGEKVVKLNQDITFKFLEGPVYGPDGNVYFTDMWLGTGTPEEVMANSQIWKIDPQGNFSVFMQPANVVNGLMFNANGDLIGCQMYGQKVIQIAPDGSVARVIADKSNGKHIDGPNDIVINRQGGMYITDPRYSPEEFWMNETEGVYYLSPDEKTLTRIIDDIEKPNGVVLSPDEKTLYVNNTMGKHIYAYDVQPDGMIANKRVFATADVPANASADAADMALMDGMCIDVQGNIYCTTNLGVQVFNSSGEHLGTIDLPEDAANITFGDEDKKALYMSGRKAMYKLRVKVPGIIFPQN